ncbi:Ankyrin-2 [Colletotrichum tanaceti]|uniref:Ankyrin-2 n=1 Tax=Colletotrichum tanaceti TaxID=1306861 RepID=A0A4U6XQ99_9PEZI|nr:Ankyrin-2 [Colletotrichum tanaceti]TKW58013.1 Ankyrin-2 [Colletotrichum tanaceti]
MEIASTKALWLVKRLIDMGASPNEVRGDDEPSALMIAIGCSIDLVKVLVQSGANPTYRSRCYFDILRCFTETQGVLGWAAGIQHHREALNMVRYLIEQVQLLYPSTPLVEFITVDAIFAAAIRGHDDVLTLLNDHGSNISSAEYRGLSALHCAAYMGQVDTCKLLLEHGALVDGPLSPKQPPSPLVLASLKQRYEVVKLLHQHGADLKPGVFIKTEDDWCSYFPDRNRILDLDIRGACSSPFLLNPAAAAVLNWTVDERDCQNLIQYLVRHGGTLPDWAVYAGVLHKYPVLVELALASPKANPNWRGPSGRTCLQVALDDNADIASALLKAGAVLVGGELQQAVLLGSWSLVEEITQRDPGGSAEQQSSMSVLEAALLTGSSVMVEWALARDPHAYTPGILCAAVLYTIQHCNLDILRRLLSNRQHSDEPNPQESSALGIAVHRNKLMILDLLSTILPVPTLVSMPIRGSYVDVYWDSRKPFWCGNKYSLVDISPLSMALNSPECLEYLLDRGCCPDEYTIVRAVKYGDLEILKRLVVMPRLKLCQDWVHEVPLVLAAEKGKLSMAAVLLNAGEDVNETSHGYFSCSPLQAAVERGNLDMISLFLKKGADVNKAPCAYFSRSPLQAAVERGNLYMINLILEARADVNGPAFHVGGATALQLAAIKGLLGIAKILVDRGADVNESRAIIGGRTALEGAAEHGRIDMIHFLLDQGAQTNGNGQVQYLRAIKLAEEEGHMVAAKMLRDYRDWTADDYRLWDRLQKLQKTWEPPTEDEDRWGHAQEEEWWDDAQEKDFADEAHSDSDSEGVDYEEMSNDTSEEDLELPDAADEVTLSEDASSDVVVENLPSGSATTPSAMAIDDPAASPEGFATDQHGFWNGNW